MLTYKEYVFDAAEDYKKELLNKFHLDGEIELLEHMKTHFGPGVVTEYCQLNGDVNSAFVEKSLRECSLDCAVPDEHKDFFDVTKRLFGKECL